MSLLPRRTRADDDEHERFEEAIDELDKRTEHLEARMRALDPEFDVPARYRPDLKVVNGE